MKAKISFQDATHFLGMTYALKSLPKDENGDLCITVKQISLTIPNEILEVLPVIEKLVIEEMNKNLKRK